MTITETQGERLLKEQFRLAVEYSKSPEANANGGLDMSDKLAFYALFKQSTEGKCSGKRPSMLQIVERTKFDAWHELGDISARDAMIRYLEKMDEAQPNWVEVVKAAQLVKFRSKL